MFTSRQLIDLYLDFFVGKRHVIIPSASLVPANDPTVQFTTAGMHPLVPYLLGESHPAGSRLANVQRCVRTGDIDAIGDATHLTYFEMLGNWSLGDYFREDAIRWSFEFLTTVLGIPSERLGVTCFAGDIQVPRDDESVRLWRSLGIERIRMLGRDDNWWGPAGPTGPCGPDTEIFIVDGERWIEIWNNVFMGYSKTASGGIEPLGRHNVDTGMGVERTVMVLNDYASVYEVDTIRPIYQALGDRVITDHIRAAREIIRDGVGPSNKDRGYVLRRLLRRAGLDARRLGLPPGWYAPYDDTGAIGDELRRFDRSLAHGLARLGKLTALDGKRAFDLFQTHGFPIELTLEIAAGQGIAIDREGIADELRAHRERSRTTDGVAGGLQDRDAVHYHTLTHLLQAALRQVLGPHVIQRGSNITRERLRFDYAHDGKPTPEQLARVEQTVNAWLARDLVVERQTMSEPEARALGAIGAFGERYGEVVSVYAIVDRATREVVSRELCGGPHVQSIQRELRGRFAIAKDQALSAGVRRIKATLGQQPS